MTETQNDALAAAYNKALDLEKSGELDAAAAAYREVLALDPDDSGGAAVRLAAMGRGKTPPKAPDAYVATLFDQHADIFESILVDRLAYCVPLMVRALLAERAAGPFRRILDLGCGTGLAGEALRDMGGHLTGLDIAEAMVEIAHDKDVYDDLYVGEAVAFLTAPGDEPPWDLVIATDVLPYMGDLAPFFAGVAAQLTPAGSFVFSSETLPPESLAGRPYMVGPHQRFAHDATYVRGTLAAHGLACRLCRPITVRLQDGAPVPGHLVLAEKPA